MSWINSDVSDPEHLPIFLRFSKTLRSYSLFKLNKEIEEFERTHPLLKLVHIENTDKKIPVLGKSLFSDEQNNYRELKYEFTKYGAIFFYEPEPDLAEWLTMIDEFKERCQAHRAKRDPLIIKKVELIRYLAHKKKYFKSRN